MKHTKLWLALVAVLALSACSGSHRPVYSGHQESTEGVPGFVDGKKVSPYVKLGQSYSVDGEWYVPRNQPDYVEEGMASWYGPGFHGGKTANGEEYDSGDMTAAHRTLPLPSVVKVTMLENGKSAYVRINDRGPFAHGRIIDLSKAVAEKIGMIGKGTARVRVEYLPQESQRFAELLAKGREPKSIDLAGEVIGQRATTMLASAAPHKKASPPKSGSWLSKINPVSTAYAEEAFPRAAPDVASQESPETAETEQSADVMEISTEELPAPAGAASAPRAAQQGSAQPSPFAAMEEAKPTAIVQPTQVAITQAYYLQLGAFLQQANAERLLTKVAALGTASVMPKTMPDQSIFYVVRMGPYKTVEESARVLAQLNELGVNPKLVSQ